MSSESRHCEKCPTRNIIRFRGPNIRPTFHLITSRKVSCLLPVAMNSEKHLRKLLIFKEKLSIFSEREYKSEKKLLVSKKKTAYIHREERLSFSIFSDAYFPVQLLHIFHSVGQFSTK